MCYEFTVTGELKTMKPYQQGFTLLEILVAATIGLLLSVAGVTAYGAVTRRARDARRSSDMEQLRQALEMYKSDNGYYLAANVTTYDTLTALVAPSQVSVSQALVPNYMAVIPQDPRYNVTTYPYPYQFRALNFNAANGRYYGYCICARFETVTLVSNTCAAGAGTATNTNVCIGNP